MWKFDNYLIILQDYQSPRSAVKALAFHSSDWKLSFEYGGAGCSSMLGSVYRNAGGNLDVVEVVLGSPLVQAVEFDFTESSDGLTSEETPVMLTSLIQ